MAKVLPFRQLSGPGRIFEEHRKELGRSRISLSVLSGQVDPFRADSRREQAEWFAAQFHRFFENKTCHVRGLHYRCVAVGNLAKHNGEIYRNNVNDYHYLVLASNDARNLGLVPFERIVDNRNDEPKIYPRQTKPWQMIVRAGSDLWLPGASAIDIEADIEGAHARQPFTLAVYGEKGSLYEILGPACERFGADLYLPAGELSSTQVYLMAKQAVEDRRELILFALTDCDPAGYNMPIAVGRKLHALACGKFQGRLSYRVIPLALTPEQAAEYDLPSTPLKATEARGDKWQDIFGREQTEIDAMLALRPDDLRSMVETAMRQFFDETLEARMQTALCEWKAEAAREIDKQVGEEIEALRDEFGDRLDEMNNTLDEINDRLADVRSSVRLPTFTTPRAEISEHDGGGVILDSRWTWLKQTELLIARKAYEGDDEDLAA